MSAWWRYEPARANPLRTPPPSLSRLERGIVAILILSLVGPPLLNRIFPKPLAAKVEATKQPPLSSSDDYKQAVIYAQAVADSKFKCCSQAWHKAFNNAFLDYEPGMIPPPPADPRDLAPAAPYSSGQQPAPPIPSVLETHKVKKVTVTKVERIEYELEKEK